MHAIRSILALLALALAAPAALASDAVVTASTVTGLSPGRLLQPDARLDIAAGQSVTLFGPSGPVEVKGPFAGAVADALGAGAAETSVVGDLMARRKRVRGLAASRSLVLGPQASAEMLHLLADRTWCVTGPAPDLYVRAAKADRVIAMIDSNGQAHEMFWPAGASTRPWPDGAAYRPGVVYEVMVGDVVLPQTLTLKAPPRDRDSLEALLSAGCAAQADALITRLDAN